MDCCCTPSRTQGTNDFFSGQAEKFLKKFRRKGLDKETALLETGILNTGVNGSSLLEIGCGVGGLHLRLLQRGAARATGVDIAEGMIEGAKQLSAELGLSGNVSYRVGDFAMEPERYEKADIVILDKVVCCYAEIDSLMKESLQRAGSTYAIVFPRPYPVSKVMFNAMIAVLKIIRLRFHPFWHDWKKMTDSITAAGFEERYAASTFLWAIRVYRRV